jgi:predicted ATPase/class 3 adenylate cyclase
VVSFVFTDVEGSTRLFRRIGDRFLDAIAEHNRLIREAVAPWNGVEVKTEGDAFFLAFADPVDAVGACLAAQLALVGAASERHEVKVRMGVHTGPAHVIDDDYVGLAVHEAARVATAGHGGQIVVSAATAAMVAGRVPLGGSLLSLGPHVLKDFPEPQVLHQLCHPDLPERFPPIRTLTARTRALPAPPSALLGRDGERHDIERLLIEGATRLVTLTGPGGVGKTRLAVDVAWDLLHQFSNGVWLIDLAAATTADAALSAIVAAVGAPTDRPPLAALADRFEGGGTLVVLDNLEQLGDDVVLVADVLASSPDLVVLATSRERLRLRGEREVRVDPLPVPATGAALADVAASPAVALFAARALGADPGFAVTDANAAVVGSLCRVLDGMPLALELAAATLRDRALEDVVAGLGTALDLLTEGERDLPPRQRALRSAILWSYDLLDAAVRRALDVLGAFRGTFTADALASVMGVDDASAVVTRLRDASLLVAADGAPGSIARWRLLETIRQFADERLATDPVRSADVRDRHAAVFAGVAAARAPSLIGEGQQQAFDDLDLDHANLLAALDRLAGVGRLRLAVDLGRFWKRRGHWLEGRRQLERAVAEPGATRDGDLAEAYLQLGSLERGLGALAEAEGRFRTGLDLLQGTGERPDVEAVLTTQRCELARQNGDADGASRLADEAIAAAGRTGDDRLLGLALHTGGAVAADAGSLDRAHRLLVAAEAALHRAGDEVARAEALVALGQVEVANRDADHALITLTDAAARAERLGLPALVGTANLVLGGIYSGTDGSAALRHLEAAVTAYENLGDLRQLARCLQQLGIARALHCDDWVADGPAIRADLTEALAIAEEARAADLRAEIEAALAQVDEVLASLSPSSPSSPPR